MQKCNFKRVAERKTTKAITAIRKLEVLANKQNYDCTKQQTDQIIKALQGEIDRLRDKFNRVRKKPSAEFTFTEPHNPKESDQ